MPTRLQFTPWIVRQRPVGDWVVQQVDRATMTTRRHGPFPTETEAREMHAILTDSEPATATPKH